MSQLTKGSFALAEPDAQCLLLHVLQYAVVHGSRGFDHLQISFFPFFCKVWRKMCANVCTNIQRWWYQPVRTCGTGQEGKGILVKWLPNKTTGHPDKLASANKSRRQPNDFGSERGWWMMDLNLDLPFLPNSSSTEAKEWEWATRQNLPPAVWGLCHQVRWQ